MKKQSNSTHSERMVIRISKDLLDRVKEKAKENELSVAAFVKLCLNVYDILNHDVMVVTKDAISKIEEVYA